jgi:hypothetical protein
MENVVFESLSNKTISNQKSVAIAFVGITILISFCWQIYNYVPFANASPQLFVGLLCLYALGFKKEVCIAGKGFVITSRTWRAKSIKLIPWEDITHITVVDRGIVSNFYVARNEEMGVKVIFHKNQKKLLIEEITKQNPKIKVSLE